MTRGFVWFHNHSQKPEDTAGFYRQLLDWNPADGPPGMTLFAGESGPFAALGASEGALRGWIPYAQVADVAAATAKAVQLGAVILQERTRGPAGDFSVVRDPGGAAIALWQKA